ncbi:RES domain-containing protein [Sphingomonas kaistensis]|uniref:RES domain-containing protein n=1 Tax=Sphingomonas kaistensis TaxID=298708 RepID=A0ABZ2G6I6_9SPHN
MDFDGLLYRSLNPLYARQPLSGEGAARFGGRFNPKGTPALYTALSIATAIREANQVGDLQPTTLVAYRATLTNLFDCRDTAALADFGMTADTLADPAWRQAMRRGGRAATQDFALALIAAGHPGLLVRSFARGADAHDLNIVLWRWTGNGARLTVIDDEARLA